MKFSVFTNLKTSQLDTIDTALTQSLLCAVISIKANGEGKNLAFDVATFYKH